MQTHVSEVAAIREQIAAEYTAAKLGLQGLNAGTSYHQFITARQERVAVLHEELHKLVGDQATALVDETVEALPDTPTRTDVLAVLRCELNNSEERALFCNHLQAAWKAVDLLKERFGDEPARKMLLAPPSSVQEISPS